MRKLRRAGGINGLRLLVAVLAGSLLVAAVLVSIWNSGSAVKQNRLHAGAIWLSSTQVGQVALLDGPSAEIAARVQIPAPHPADLVVVQDGTSAYAVNRSEGSISRIDGATLTLTGPKSPIPGAGLGLHVLPGTGMLYVLDVQQGLVVGADPKTVDARGRSVPLVKNIDENDLAVGRDGTLWVLNSGTGDITRVRGSEHWTRKGVIQPGASMLVVANGNPVIVDLASQVARTLDSETARTAHITQLDWLPSDNVQVSGSLDTNRLYITAPRGSLAVCDLDQPRCDDAEPIAGADADLGVSVEVGRHVFVPDFRNGRVHIVDLVTGLVAAQSRVTQASKHFELTGKDGIAFFNEPDTERAGVIDPDGTVRTVAKYDTRTPPDDRLDSAQHTAGRPLERPSDVHDAQPATTTAPKSATEPAGSSDRLALGGKSTLQMSVSNERPRINELVNLEVAATAGAKLAAAHWSFGDGQESDQLHTSHRWTVAATYQVSVRGSFENGQDAVGFVAVQVIADAGSSVTLTVSPPSGGTVTDGAQIHCSPSCRHVFSIGTTVVLTAEPAEGFTFMGWSGGCTGANRACNLIMTGDEAVSATFGSISLPAPLHVSPADGAVLTELSYDLMLEWRAVADAATYVVEVECLGCGERGVWTPRANTTTPATNYSIIWPGNYEGRWRITAVDTNGTGGIASVWWRFSYIALPPAPLQVSPSDGAIDWVLWMPASNPDTMLDWEPVAVADHYFVEVECLGCLVTGEWTHYYSDSPTLTEIQLWRDADRDYRWRVTVVTADGTRGISSPWWRFSVVVLY